MNEGWFHPIHPIDSSYPSLFSYSNRKTVNKKMLNVNMDYIKDWLGFGFDWGNLRN